MMGIDPLEYDCAFSVGIVLPYSSLNERTCKREGESKRKTVHYELNMVQSALTAASKNINEKIK